MTKTWVTFKDKFGSILAGGIEMDNLPRQGEVVYIAGTTFRVQNVTWLILPAAKGYREVTVYLE